jgi:hypothetical protein
VNVKVRDSGYPGIVKNQRKSMHLLATVCRQGRVKAREYICWFYTVSMYLLTSLSLVNLPVRQWALSLLTNQ